MSPILALETISKTFTVNRTPVHALQDVNLTVEAGECVAIVGESGSGKTTLANIMLGVYPPSTGEVRFAGQVLPASRQLPQRRAIQFVQQNPLSALNPRRSVGASIRLGMDVHNLGAPGERNARVASLLEEVGLDPAFARRSPTTLSGGQRQRVAIARALACDPQILVLDEPTSALDVLVQGRVLRLLNDLRARHKLTYIFISHDLAVVRNIAERVAVFERGRLIELAPTEIIFNQPSNPYTRRLIAAVPVVTEAEARLRQQASEDIQT